MRHPTRRSVRGRRAPGAPAALPHPVRTLAALVVLATLAGACSSGGVDDAEDGSSSLPTTVPTAVGGGPAGIDPEADRGGGRVDLDGDLEPVTFEVNPGVETLTVTGAEAGQSLTLLTSGGVRIVTGTTDDAGQLHVAYVPDQYLEVEGGLQNGLPTTEGGVLPPGTYRVVVEGSDPPQVSEPSQVLDSDDVPDDPGFYEQDLTADCPDFEETRRCYTYIETRDGVTLSATIRLPDPGLYGDPPYPTVIEYSGYGPSNPEGDGEPGSRIAMLLGFATVGVNMRASGCSGGVFDTFNPAQQADGYDVVEAIARESWVLNGSPGMIGLSYSGIGQLYAASTAPPSLAAIAPLSVIEDPWLMQWPGGVYNGGFTKQWLTERDRANAPDGSSWVATRIEEGDEHCADNVELRSQNPDFEAFARALEFRPRDADNRRLALLVSDIDVPVYLTGAWQDEQTGAKFATMLDRFDQAPVRRFTLFNGHHPDGYTPLVLTRWYEFLSFYVARRTPDLSDLVQAAAPAVFEQEFGVRLGFEEDRFAGMDYEDALAAYEAEPEVRVLFESGWGHPEVPGAPQATFEATFDSWPPPAGEAASWFLGSDGTLVAEAPSTSADVAYRHDPDAGPTLYTDASAYDFQKPSIPFDWARPPEGSAVVFAGDPVEETTVLAGAGHLRLWVRPEVDDLTVEATLSEVRADGTEVRIQGGWLRVGHVVMDEELSSGVEREPTYSEDDFVAPVPGEWTEAVVPIYPFAHLLRPGSRLVLRIDDPGRDMPLWSFENPIYDGEVHHTIGVGGEHASELVLLALPGVEVPEAVVTDVPPCPSLRGQVCRPWEPTTNTPAE